MTANKPDFSPAMLSVLLRARAEFRVIDSGEPWRRTETVKAFKAETRRRADVTHMEFHMAWMGWLNCPVTRGRLWAVLGHCPTDYGVTLTHGGQDG
ncbi:hypothetical protein [Chelativorans sp. YIM 93263]|uniref:hypothetical protein n=1 Tax=Chelativorans sp. YIM 93263 TaxID=2906648 RepID=UPI00237865BA|nr:hypothetical protein [Chelativorans sp. YIM 93263]